MPAFFTHWLVAGESLKTIPTGKGDAAWLIGYLKVGEAKYKEAANEFSKSLYAKVRSATTKNDFKKLEKSGLDDLLADFEKKIHAKKHRDNILCYSAYILGACGPDFWTLPSGPAIKIPNTAGIHFDSGHYHRTHCQFQVAIKRWKAHDPLLLQDAVEKSYFLGMATHIATDLMGHQLVNISAGAYKLLKKEGWFIKTGPWENEEGLEKINIWNTHNKVEHYWDSYLRYRYFGDIGAVWAGTDDANWYNPLGFPLVESLKKTVLQAKAHDATSRMLKWLSKDSVRFKIEKCFNIPHVVCDKILGKEGITSFIYDVVVDKTSGAYPKELVYSEMTKEATSKQMTDPDGAGYNEKRKLQFFSSDMNKGSSAMGHNYLCYYACPGLGRLRKYGNNVFYHLDALKPFLDSSIKVARIFAGDLLRAMGAKDENNLGSVDHFWNLDTGLGLEVNEVRSSTTHEVITRLNFINIADFMKHSRVADKLKYSKYVFKGRKSRSFKNPTNKIPEFKTYVGGPFKDLNSVNEADDAKTNDKYLERINLNQSVGQAADQIKISNFFTDMKKTAKLPKTAASKNAGTSENKLTHGWIGHRLTLQVETSIAEFNKSPVGFYFMRDSTNKIGDAVSWAENRAVKWIKDAKTKAVDFVDTEDKGMKSRFKRRDGLCVFRSHLLLNLESEEDKKKPGASATREVAKDKWNNVVEHSKHKSSYSRNYAIGLGRKNVLWPIGNDVFAPNKDFDYYRNISPTEHVFFCLYLVVNNNGVCYDLLSHEKVDEAKLKKMKRIDCLDFMKIVLFYVLDAKGATMLDECFIDGMKVPVRLSTTI